MARPAIQSAHYEFTVRQVPILTPNGKPSGFFANHREDTDAYLGVTSEQYGIVQNADLVAAAEAALEVRGMTGYEKKVIVTGAGERMFAQFTFKNLQLKNGVGDVFGYRLTVQNSFDRTLRASMELGFLRLTCLNGAVSLEKELSLTRKHSSTITADFVADAIAKAVSKGQTALQAYDLMARANISDEQGVNVLNHLVLRGILSGSLSEAIKTLWLSPRRAEDKGRNLYNLYNAVTEHLTHGVSGERYEYASKVNHSSMMALWNAARNPARLSELVVPVPTDATTALVIDV